MDIKILKGYFENGQIKINYQFYYFSTLNLKALHKIQQDWYEDGSRKEVRQEKHNRYHGPKINFTYYPYTTLVEIL